MTLLEEHLAALRRDRYSEATPGPPANWDPTAVGPTRELRPRPVIMSHPIRATVRVAAFHLDTQAARAELAAAKLRAAVLAQIEDALPGITPDGVAQLLKFTEHETQVTTQPDGCVTMTVSYDVVTRSHALGPVDRALNAGSTAVRWARMLARSGDRRALAGYGRRGLAEGAHRPRSTVEVLAGTPVADDVARVERGAGRA